ncbi:MAG: RCC1 domain-containing protein [Eubacteriales bacterium]
MAEQDSRIQGEMLYYPVPRIAGQEHLETPIPTPDTPAVLSYIIRVKRIGEDGSPEDLIYFYIGRDRALALAAFTVSYRFSALPVMVEDPEHPFYTYQYTDADINDDNAYIVCKFALPPSLSEHFPGCGAFVSAITFPDGTSYTFGANDFTYADGDMAKLEAAMTAVYDIQPQTETGGTVMTDSGGEDETFDALEEEQRRQEAARKKRRRGVRIIGYSLLAAGGVTLAAIGIQSLSYQRTMLGAQVFLDAREYRQAEQYVSEQIGGSLFYKSRLSALTRTAKQLCAEGRYNEAYKIVSLTPYATLLQSVCREAAEAALAEDDYESAYVYACGAPDPFDGEIVASAAAVLLDPYTETMNESAYRVAQKTTDTEARDDLLLAIVRYACAGHEYHVAMRAARKITDSEIGAATVADVFGIATRYYIGQGSYEAAADYISMYAADGGTVDADIKDALIAYFSESRDAESAFFLARQFGIDASDIPIKAGDRAVQNDLSGTYFLLTAEQKRAYHAHIVSAGGILFTVNRLGGVTLAAKPSGVTPADGTDTSMEDAQLRVNNLLKGKSAVVSVVSGELTTAFLHTDGSVTMFSNRIIGSTVTTALPEENRLIADAEKINGAVAIAAGESHFVCLMDDGTVVCSGDNTYGQCNTNGSAWRDIVAVAAGKNFTLGLKSDGSVVACGSDACGQCDVSGFNNVVEIAACDQTTVVRFSDGSVGIRGERSMGLADAETLTGVTRIRAGGSAVIAERADGTYTICGTSAETGNYGSVASWHNVLDYDVGSVCAAAVDEDGVLRTTGSNRAKQ